MQIVGLESQSTDEDAVHTIDVWYSRRREAWIVERLNAEGAQVGWTQISVTREDAEACVAEWLRAHVDTHLVGSEMQAVRRKRLRRAA